MQVLPARGTSRFLCPTFVSREGRNGKDNGQSKKTLSLEAYNIRATIRIDSVIPCQPEVGCPIVAGCMPLRVQVPNKHIYLPKTYTIITISQNPSTYLLGTWTLRARAELLRLLLGRCART